MSVGKKAEAGIGTLILFIAMILVAAVAASVLISTSNSLQTRALSTGSQAKDQVTTGVQYLNIYADDASSDSTIETFYLEMRLVSGSDIIKIEDATLEFEQGTAAQSLSYNQTVADCSAAANSNDRTFNVEYLQNGSQNIPGYLSSGDIVTLCFDASTSVTEDEQLTFSLIPKTGGVARLQITTPPVMTEKTVYLYP